MTRDDKNPDYVSMRRASAASLSFISGNPHLLRTID